MSEHVDTIVLAPTTFSQEEFGGNKGSPSARWAQPRTSAATRASAPAGTPSSQEVQDALLRINEHLASVNRVIDLQVDPQTSLTIATVRNSNTGEVLQQYPAEDSLHLAQMLASWSHGGNILLDLIA